MASVGLSRPDCPEPPVALHSRWALPPSCQEAEAELFQLPNNQRNGEIANHFASWKYYFWCELTSQQQDDL